MRNKDMIPVARFPLPDDWSPEGIVCLSIPVPNDSQFIAALIGITDQLKYSFNFARDDTRTGAATVARTWREALASQPITIVDCEGAGGVMEVRQNPETPCILEYRNPGDDLWIAFADLTLCPPLIMPNS